MYRLALATTSSNGYSFMTRFRLNIVLLSVQPHHRHAVTADPCASLPRPRSRLSASTRPGMFKGPSAQKVLNRCWVLRNARIESASRAHCQTAAGRRRLR
jgi:hypothetical protein